MSGQTSRARVMAMRLAEASCLGNVHSGEKGEGRPRLVKIMHIDLDYHPHYILIKERSFIHSTVSLEAALVLLKSEEFDLILSEPHNIAILKKQRNPNPSTSRRTGKCLGSQ